MTEAPHFYLDDCSYDRELVARLRQAGFQVTVPAEVGLTGRPDVEHFRYARSAGKVLITANPRDFWLLHSQEPGHAGILAVYHDNDYRRDMNVAEILEAIQHLLSTPDVPLAGQFIPLNAWRVS